MVACATSASMTPILSRKKINMWIPLLKMWNGWDLTGGIVCIMPQIILINYSIMLFSLFGMEKHLYVIWILKRSGHIEALSLSRGRKVLIEIDLSMRITIFLCVWNRGNFPMVPEHYGQKLTCLIQIWICGILSSIEYCMHHIIERETHGVFIQCMTGLMGLKIPLKGSPIPCARLSLKITVPCMIGI